MRASEAAGTMPLVSVQITAGPRIIKRWGIVNACPTATVWDTYVGIKDGTIESASTFVFPPEMVDQPVNCSVGPTMSGTFQDCPLNILVQDVALNFGKSVVSQGVRHYTSESLSVCYLVGVAYMGGVFIKKWCLCLTQQIN